jgi:hypothetical protein
LDELPLLVFKMREVAHRFLLGLGYSLGGTLFVTAPNDFGNTLEKDELKSTLTRRYGFTLSTLWQQYSLMVECQRILSRGEGDLPSSSP